VDKKGRCRGAFAGNNQIRDKEQKGRGGAEVLMVQDRAPPLPAEMSIWGAKVLNIRRRASRGKGGNLPVVKRKGKGVTTPWIESNKEMKKIHSKGSREKSHMRQREGVLHMFRNKGRGREPEKIGHRPNLRKGKKGRAERIISRSEY